MIRCLFFEMKLINETKCDELKSLFEEQIKKRAFLLNQIEIWYKIVLRHHEGRSVAIS